VNISRRALLGGFMAMMSRPGRHVVAASRPLVTVYKSPTCGCCTLWVAHLKDAGFPVKAEDVADVAPIKDKHGVPKGLASCHTALVDGYVIEGHVPADLIDRLLADRPRVVGLAVPGMPLGSPGMEAPGRAPERYQILTFDHSGRTGVFATR